MILAPYRDVLADRRVLGLLVLGVAVRIPATSGLALTFYVVQTLGRSYAEAGVVATCFTVGAAIGAPWRGRRVDVAGLRRALVPSIVIESSCFAAASFAPYLPLLMLAFLGGLFTLPSFSVIRQSLAVLVPERDRRTAFSLDSIGVEIAFMIGPALSVWVATAVDPRFGLRAMAALVLIAGLLLFGFNPPTSSTPATSTSGPAEPAPNAEPVSTADGRPPVLPTPVLPASGVLRRLLPAWFSLPLLLVLATTTGATIVLYGTDVSIFARLRELEELSYTGLVFAVWSLGSISGALIYGQLRRPPGPLQLLLALAVLTAPLALAGNVLTVAAGVFVAGGACAPVITATAEVITRLVPEAHRGAALGWHASALTLGGAIGGPFTGAAIDRHGAGAGPLSVAGAGLLIAAVGLSVRRGRAVGTAGSSAG